MNTRIITTAQGLINATGIETITFESLANQMRIFQQTTYKLFPGKVQLIEAVIDKEMKDKNIALQMVRRNATNSIQQVFFGWNVISDFFKRLNNELVGQLNKYYIQSYKLVIYFKLNIDRDKAGSV